MVGYYSQWAANWCVRRSCCFQRTMAFFYLMKQRKNTVYKKRKNTSTRAKEEEEEKERYVAWFSVGVGGKVKGLVCFVNTSIVLQFSGADMSRSTVHVHVH